MGASQSQDNRSQTFSTIGLPPAQPYPRQPIPDIDSPRQPPSIDRVRGRERLYRSNDTGDSDTSGDWIQVNRVPPRITQTPPPPPPRGPPRSHDSQLSTTDRGLDILGSNRPRQRSATSRSLRDDDNQEFANLEELLSTLQLHFGARSQTNEDGGEQTQRRRRQHHHSSGSVDRPRPRLRHHNSASTGAPLLFIRGLPKVKCPLCSKEFTPPDLEEHLPICSSKPRVQFNADKLIQYAGECSICLDDMVAGDEIARLPCLCVYHLQCLKGWYKKSQTCPEHPDMKG